MKHSRTVALFTSTICLFWTVCCVTFSGDVPEPEPVTWRNDFGVFQQCLTELTETGTIPSAESLAACTDVFVMTDGAGGLIDPSPEADTLQSLLNREFNHQKVRWKIKIYYDSLRSMWNHSLLLAPLPSPEIDLTSETSLESLSVIGIYIHGIVEDEQPEFHMGDTLLVEATIGRGELTSSLYFSGVLAVQHLSEQDKPYFVVGMHDAKITRLSSDHPKHD